MRREYLEEEFILEYVSEHLGDFIEGCVVVNDAKFHHNTPYTKAPSLIRNNILSLEEQTKKRLKNFTEEELKLYDDMESHANGSSGISLAIVGLDDLSEDEMEYDPFGENQVDFLIQSDIKAMRNSVHYGNEFITFDQIEAEKFKAIDIRIAKYIDILLKKGNEFDSEAISTLVQRYNCLRNIAITLKQEGLDVPIREMSYDNCSSLDIEKVASSPKLVLKS